MEDYTIMQNEIRRLHKVCRDYRQEIEDLTKGTQPAPEITKGTPFENLTRAQYDGLSWLAFYHRSIKHREEEIKLNNETKKSPEQFNERLRADIVTGVGSCNGIEAVLSNVLKVPSELIYTVKILNNCKGLLNLNKLTTVVYWEY